MKLRYLSSAAALAMLPVAAMAHPGHDHAVYSAWHGMLNAGLTVAALAVVVAAVRHIRSRG